MLSKNVSRRAKHHTETISIGILIGARNENEEARSLTWIPALQQRVAKRGWNVFIHDRIPEISRSPETGLSKLFKSTRHKCWLLILCSQKIQQVFDTQALKMGIHIPEDLTLISRHERNFLHHLDPVPAYYEFNPRTRAVKIHQLLEERIQGDTLRNHRTLLIPEFRPGRALGKETFHEVYFGSLDVPIEGCSPHPGVAPNFTIHDANK